MSRIVDKPYFTYSAYNALTAGIQVKCPKCQGFGIVTEDRDDIYFKCTHCYHTMKYQTSSYCRITHCTVKNLCCHCGRYYRIEIKDPNQQNIPSLYVICPYCGTTMAGKVHKKTGVHIFSTSEIKKGREPYFGLELWFLTSFQGKPVWALNREHLAYLISYLSADLREKPAGTAKRTQADHIPTFMKTAKNREKIVKLLKKLQER